MERTLTELRYMVSLSEDEMLKIIQIDSDRVVEDGDTLYDILIGVEEVQEVNYDGMFGAYIWITVEPDNDTPGVWKKVLEAIKKYIE